MSYLLAFLGFAALIILHEFGHFAAAKAVGMRVERFSLFFGPLLVRFRRGETEYGIGPIPLGGYVRITGMNPRERLGEEDELDEREAELERTRSEIAASRATSPAQAEKLTAEERALAQRVLELRDRVASIRRRAYYNQPVWKRIVVILAGPAVNLVIAFVLLAGIFWSNGIGLTHGKQAVWQVAGQLQPPGSRYLKVGDKLTKVDSTAYPSELQLAKAVNSHTCAGKPVDGCQARTPVKLTVLRRDRPVALSIYPRYDATAGRMRVGFSYDQAIRAIGPLTAAGTSVSQMWYVTRTTVSTVGRLFEPKERRQLHSVVGAFRATQQRFNYNSTEALYTLALISLSLAVINLFPFLPLDGGHVFWALAEKVRGKRIPFEVLERAGAVGFALILIVFAIGLSNDISNLPSIH